MDRNGCVIGIDEVFLRVNKLWRVVQKRIKEYPFPEQPDGFLTEFQRFTWSDTPEGYEYWDEVHTRFKAYRELHWNMQPFERFLRCNNLYNKFMINAFGKINDQTKGFFNTYLISVYWRLYMGIAFDWQNSPEGLEFWEKWDRKWQTLVQNYSEEQGKSKKN